MNETPDAFEEELAAFRPREVSPELRGRIAGRLRGATSRTARRAWTIAVVSGLAAAGLAAVLLKGPSRPAGNPGPGPVDVAGPVSTRPDLDSPPTVEAYRLALSRSPEAFDALLDRHAARISGAAQAQRPDRLRALGPGSPVPRGEF